MGFFKDLKAQVAAAQAAMNAMTPPEPIPGPAEFINAWPQDEVDRLLQGTGTIRAIVLGKSHQILEPGERVGRMRVKVRLRPRGPEGSLGDEVTVNASISSLTASLIERGLDIPVERDAATGAITKVASAQLTEELSSRKDEAKKRNPGWALDQDIEGMIETGQALGKAIKGKPDEPQR